MFDRDYLSPGINRPALEGRRQKRIEPIRERSRTECRFEVNVSETLTEAIREREAKYNKPQRNG